MTCYASNIVFNITFNILICLTKGNIGVVIIILADATPQSSPGKEGVGGPAGRKAELVNTHVSGADGSERRRSVHTSLQPGPRE